VASVLAGKYNSPLLLVDREGLKSTNNAVEYIKNNADKTTDLQIVGGTGAVPKSIENTINNEVSGENQTPQTQTFTGYITTEDDFAAELGEDTADMVYMKMMALSGLGITYQDKDGKWVFYYLDGDISTDNTDGADGKWKFNGTGSQLSAWNIVENQIKSNNGADKMKPVPVKITGILDGSTQTNPGPDADGIDYPVIKVQSITDN
ncbi:cell wall-binding repeat-containing protein, partial [Clostridium sp.]